MIIRSVQIGYTYLVYLGNRFFQEVEDQDWEFVENILTTVSKQPITIEYYKIEDGVYLDALFDEGYPMQFSDIDPSCLLYFNKETEKWILKSTKKGQ